MAQLACMTILYMNQSFERALAGIARAGYRHVVFGYLHEGKLVPDEADEASWERIAGLLRQYGLKPAMLISHSHFGVNEPMERGFRQMDIAEALGIRRINVLGTYSYYKFPDRPKPLALLEEENKQFVDRMKQFAEAAEERNLVISIKPHTGNSATAPLLKRTLEAVGSPNFRAAYDPGNVDAYEGVDPLEGFADIAKVSSAFFAKDHRGGRYANDFPVPGEGGMNFREMFRLLRQYDFDGPVVVEKINAGGVEFGPDEMDLLAKRARLNLERLMRESGLEPEN